MFCMLITRANVLVHVNGEEHSCGCIYIFGEFTDLGGKKTSEHIDDTSLKK